MKQYLDALRLIRDTGRIHHDRTGVGTKRLFGLQYRVDLTQGFPLLTTKRVYFKSVVTELLWFLSGRTDNQWLEDRGCTIWREWATPEQCAKFGRPVGDLGPVYGWAWRHFGGDYALRGVGEDNGFDQITWLVNEIKTNPNSRRMIVSAWNPKDAGTVALPPCHTMFHVSVQDGELSLQLYQRSADFFLGVPFNLASYALLTGMLAHVTGNRAGSFIHTFGDAHIYLNHAEQVDLQLSREPRALPTVALSSAVTSIFNFKPEDIVVTGYEPEAPIKAPVAI